MAASANSFALYLSLCIIALIKPTTKEDDEPMPVCAGKSLKYDISSLSSSKSK